MSEWRGKLVKRDFVWTVQPWWWNVRMVGIAHATEVNRRRRKASTGRNENQFPGRHLETIYSLLDEELHETGWTMWVYTYICTGLAKETVVSSTSNERAQGIKGKAFISAVSAPGTLCHFCYPLGDSKRGSHLAVGSSPICADLKGHASLCAIEASGLSGDDGTT